MKDTVNSIRYSEYQLGRSEKYPDTFLKGYEGNIHTDAYSGYNVVSGVVHVMGAQLVLIMGFVRWMMLMDSIVLKKTY